MIVTTLATEVEFYEGEPDTSGKSFFTQPDVPVEVFMNARKDRVALWVGRTSQGTARIELNGGERIALIEALGGKA